MKRINLFIAGPTAPGFGDMWANVSYILDNSKEEIYITNYISNQQKNQFLEIFPLIDTKLQRKIIWINKLSNYNNYTVQEYHQPYYRTKLKWEDKIFINKRKSLSKPIIALQFESQNKNFLPEKFLKPYEKFLFKKWLISKFHQYDFRELGKPLTASQSVEIACLSSLFIGICSGQSHLCHSVGVPMLLRNWQGNMLRFYHPNKVYEDFKTIDEMKRKVDMILSPSYSWNYKSR